ncbi:MAG: acyl-CoA desaturase [Leptospirales bacterium]
MSVDVFFNNKKDKFYDDLKKRVNKYFKDNNLSKKANLQMYINTLVLFSITYASYFLILFGGFSWPIMLFFVFTMGFGVAGCGMGFMHDGSHNAYSDKPWVNNLIGSSLNLLGSHKYIWDLRHNAYHHMYTNVYKYDFDMVKIWLVRHSPEAKKRWFHKYQHIYASFVVYPYYTIFWLLVYDVLHLNLFRQPIGDGELKKHPMSKIISIVFWRLFYLFYIIVIPYLVLGLPFWQIMVGFLALHVSTSLFLCTIFQVAHIVEETVHGIPDKNGKINDTWAQHQVKASCNFSLKNKLMTWYCGGLNYQIEHHLLPNVCSIHYPNIQPIIKATIEEHGLPYNVHPSIAKAYGSHLKALKKLGNE